MQQQAARRPVTPPRKVTLPSEVVPPRAVELRTPTVQSRAIPCVLVVEGHPSLRELYRSELEASGYRVFTARSGEEALDWFKTAAQPDAMVLDIQLGGIDGIQVMRHVLQQHPNLPVLLHSAYTHYRRNLACWCADAFVEKSMPGALARRLGEVLAARSRSAPSRGSAVVRPGSRSENAVESMDSAVSS